jgi:hypothetical protein
MQEQITIMQQQQQFPRTDLAFLAINALSGLETLVTEPINVEQ